MVAIYTFDGYDKGGLVSVQKDSLSDTSLLTDSVDLAPTSSFDLSLFSNFSPSSCDLLLLLEKTNFNLQSIVNVRVNTVVGVSFDVIYYPEMVDYVILLKRLNIDPFAEVIDYIGNERFDIDAVNITSLKLLSVAKRRS